MSCNNSKCYLPIPPRAWSRVQNGCSLFDENTYSGTALVPLPYTGRLVPASTLYLEYAMLSKGNVLQYKKNSSNLTKQQRYAQIAKGKWTNRNTTWATQSTRGYTNPNNQSLQRVNSINITLDGQPTFAPVTCPKPVTPVYQPLPATSSSGANPEVIPPPPPPPTTNSGTALPATIVETPVEPIVIQDLGNLVCGTQENVCTGELITQLVADNCHPTSDSDVPGPIMELCWNDGNPTWYPRQRYVMTNSGNKWPVNATLLSSVKILPPTIVSSNVINNEITLTWTHDERCIPATEFTIYENGIPVKIVSGTTFTTTILLPSVNGEYVFYIVAINTRIISEPSNSVTVIVDNGCYYKIFGMYSVANNARPYTITFTYNPMNSNSIQLGCSVNNISTTLVGGGGGGGAGKPSGETTTTTTSLGGGGGGGGGIYFSNINLVADTYNIVVGNLGQGSNNTNSGANGGDSYIQSSSSIIAIAYGGSGGASVQFGQITFSAGGTGGSGGGTGGGTGGSGGSGGTNQGSGGPGTNGLISYSGGGGGGWGGNYETPPLTGIGQGGQNNAGGVGGTDSSSESIGNGVGYGTGGGGGPNINSGGNGAEGVIIFVI